MIKKIKITQEQSIKLYGKNDREKGEAIEEIVKQILIDLGADEVINYTNLQEQVVLGDLKVIKNNKIINIEVKKSYTYRKEKKDNLGIDILYFKYKNGKIIPYEQETTKSSKGWLYITQADWLICLNIDSNKLYIIKQFQKLKQQIIKDIEKYKSKFTQNWKKAWYCRRGDNINRYIRIGIKNDKTKETFNVFLELSKESLKFYKVKYVIIDIDLVVENKKSL